MEKPKPLTKEQVKKVLAYRKRGLTFKQIGKLIKRSDKAVSAFFKTATTKNPVEVVDTMKMSGKKNVCIKPSKRPPCLIATLKTFDNREVHIFPCTSPFKMPKSSQITDEGKNRLRITGRFCIAFRDSTTRVEEAIIKITSDKGYVLLNPKTERVDIPKGVQACMCIRVTKDNIMYLNPEYKGCSVGDIVSKDIIGPTTIETVRIERVIASIEAIESKKAREDRYVAYKDFGLKPDLMFLTACGLFHGCDTKPQAVPEEYRSRKDFIESDKRFIEILKNLCCGKNCGKKK